jgi:tetratricopeptide (TPR) repeat protein
MRFVRHTRLAVLGLILAAAPARAEIMDIQAEQATDELRILFVFDSQPAGASVTISGSEAQATIAGAHGAGRLLRPEANGLRQISVDDRPLGLSIGAVAQRPILAAEAEVFRNAVMFRLTLAPAPPPFEEAPQAALDAAAAANPEAGAPEPGPTRLLGDLAEDSVLAAVTPEPPAELQAAPDTSLAEASAVAAPSDMTAPQSADAVLAAEAAAHGQAVAEAETALAQAGAEIAAAEAALAAPESEAPAGDDSEPQWAEDDAAERAPVPVRRSPPGAASELLAAQLDRVACDAAARTIGADTWALDALYNHGACLARDGQRDRALEVFQRLEMFDPTSARTLVALGVLRQDEGDRAGAQDYYERAMATAPEDGLAVLINLLRGL